MGEHSAHNGQLPSIALFLNFEAARRQQPVIVIVAMVVTEAGCDSS